MSLLIIFIKYFFRFRFPENPSNSTSHRKQTKKRKQAQEKLNEYEELIGPYIRHIEHSVIISDTTLINK